MNQDRLLSVDEALARVVDVDPLPQETVSLTEAFGRVLAHPLRARRTQPPFDCSAMDGYAVRGAEAVAGAGLRLIGEAAAGHVYAGTLGPGEAVRIFTGGAVPDGADTVLVQEDAEITGDRVLVRESASFGRHIRKAGIDFREGDELSAGGTLLGARMLGLAAALGHAEVPVYRRPRVAVLLTGDELVLPGGEIGAGQIVASNGFSIAAIVANEGAVPVDLGIAPDDIDAIRAKLRMARDMDADVLVTLGGASVGDHDLVRPALEAEGMALDFWKVAMRPGRPVMAGRLDPMRVIGLPGNPVSSHMCAHLFVRPLLRALQGRRDTALALEPAIADVAMPANDWRQDYLRARIVGGDFPPRVSPFPRQDSSMLRVLAESDCLIVRSPHDAEIPAGGACRIIRLDERS